MKKTLIKGGNVVLGGDVCKQDILIEGEKISAVGDLPGIPASKEYNAQGLLVLPGAVDTHVHFNDEFMNTKSVHDYETGTRAAAFGGVTTVVDFSNQIPGKPLIHTLKKKKQEAEGMAMVDWGVHPVITDAAPEILNEIPLLVEKGAPTIKCYMVYREEGLMVEEDDLKRIMEQLNRVQGMLMVHAEDNNIIEKNISSLIKQGLIDPIYHAKSRPPEAENKAIKKCIRLADQTQAKLFIVHMSTAKGVQLVGQAQNKGIDVKAETCIHYLYFTENQLEREDGIKWICSPPLRSKSNQEKLWEGLRDKRISIVTTDDAAYSWDPHKQFGVPIPNSVLFVKNEQDFERMALFSDYFNPTQETHPNPGLKSAPSTRPFSALPLITSILHQGLKKIRQRLRSPLDAVKKAALKIESEPELELCLKPDTGILCFRVVPNDLKPNKINDLQEYIYEEIMSKGERTLSKTKFGNKTALRLVAVSPDIKSKHLLETAFLSRNIARTY